MFVQRSIQFSSTRGYFSDIANTVRALSYFDEHDDDDYYSPHEIAKLLHDNEYEEVLDGFHIEEEVHELDDDVYQMYYEILLKK
jgi:hypothetical protein